MSFGLATEKLSRAKRHNEPMYDILSVTNMLKIIILRIYRMKILRKHYQRSFFRYIFSRFVLKYETF